MRLQVPGENRGLILHLGLFFSALPYIIEIQKKNGGSVKMALEFEWDEEKARKNLKKHGVPFELAAKVFLDENRIEIYDEANSIDEDRYITIGMTGDILFVVYTERYPRIRLISARLATARERKVYYGEV